MRLRLANNELEPTCITFEPIPTTKGNTKARLLSTSLS